MSRAGERRPQHGAPAPECDADELVLLLLGARAPQFWGPSGYDWRSAHAASWSVPVASCVRCRGEQYGCLGLRLRGTTHSACYPEVAKTPSLDGWLTAWGLKPA